MTRKRKKNSECSNGNMPVYCHYDKEIKLCRECWPCQECDLALHAGSERASSEGKAVRYERLHPR